MKTYLLNVWDSWLELLVRADFVRCGCRAAFFDGAAAGRGDREIWQVATGVDSHHDADCAPTLSAMSGAMMAVTGTVFSITIVTLSLTSQQFGPRLLRRFMYDLPTQVTLGVFLSTGLYCLLVLRIVEHDEGGAAAPHLSVLLAVMLSVLSMAMLIVFIHHVAMLIQGPHVVAAVTRDLDDAIARLFPEEIGDAVGDEQRNNDHGRDQAARLDEEHLDCSFHARWLHPGDRRGWPDAVGSRTRSLAAFARSAGQLHRDRLTAGGRLDV